MANDTDRLPGIPAVDRTIDKNIRAILEPVRQILTQFTTGTNPVTRMKSLQSAGLIGGFDGQDIVVPDGSDFTPPPAPTGLTADGALANIILSWDETTYANLAFTEIWRAESNSFALAVKVGAASAGASVYIDNVNHTGTWYYWIRYVSLANVPGPFNAQVGVAGTTGIDPASLIELLVGNAASPYYGEFPFLVIEADTIINGVPVPAGVYIRDAYIANGTISNAKIGNLAVDSAKIALLAVGTAQIADLAVASAKMADLSVTTAKIALLAVGNAQIANLSVDTLKIGNQAVTFPYAITGSPVSLAAGSSTITNLVSTTLHTFLPGAVVTVFFVVNLSVNTVPTNTSVQLTLFNSAGTTLKFVVAEFGEASNFGSGTGVWTGSIDTADPQGFRLQAVVSKGGAITASVTGTIYYVETKR